MVNCLLTFLKGKSTLFLVETKRLLTWREEDSSIRKILQCGSSQRHMLDSVYMQRVILAPSASIFTAERLEDPSTSKILAPCKLPSL